MTQFVYLHGFASSPGSKKAAEFRKKFAESNLSLTIPDLECGGFERLTLSRQLDTVETCLDGYPGEKFGLIGSSMGGYLAVLVAQSREDVAAIYLMCPGFNFLKRWKLRLGLDLSHPDEDSGLIPVYHYRYNKSIGIRKDIFRDAEKWAKHPLDRSLPTRIVHGVRDDTVDIGESRDFVRTRAWCRLQELDSDHSLISHIDWITADCLEFFRAEGLL